MTTENRREELFFKSLINDYFGNPRFVRRNWLANEVIECLEDASHPFILLTTEPGFGKSVFMAQLARDHPDWPRYFIRRDQREVLAEVSARSFLLRIGFQLAARYPQIFERKTLEVAVEQRIGAVHNMGEVVGVEVGKIIASPFYQGVIKVNQHINSVSGEVVGVRIDELVFEPHLINSVDLQNMALIDPAHALQRLHPDQQIVILVDALDEVRYHHTPDDLLTWLTNCPELPGNVRFVLTARPPDGAVRLFMGKQVQRIQCLNLEGSHRETFRRVIDQDVETYVGNLLEETQVKIQLDAQPNGIGRFRTDAIAKADGNLGYLDALARGIDQALSHHDVDTLQALLTLKTLPDDMQGLYAFFLHQIKRSVARERIEIEDPETGEIYDKAVWPAVHRRILGVLAVVREPVSLILIQRLGGITADWTYLTAAAESFMPFLDVIDNRYRFYHATLPDFLTDSRTRNTHETQELFVDMLEWHKRISDYYWRTFSTDWSGCDTYGLYNLAAHLYQGGLTKRLYALCDCSYRQAKIEHTGSPFAFAQDVELALSTLRSDLQHNAVQWARLCAAFARGVSAAPPLIIDVLARSSQPVRAQWMAANITFAVDRSRAYTLIADHYVHDGEMDGALRMLDEAERTLPAINEAHRTMAEFWLVSTALAMGDIERTRTLMADGERIAFADGPLEVDAWDLPNVLFWLAKTARLFGDEVLLARIRQMVHVRAMGPVRNMVLQTMSVAGDMEGLRSVAQDRLNQPQSSVRLANLALALAHIGLRDLCEEILALIDAGAPDHGGDDNPKRHIWARALLGHFDDALTWANTLDDAEQKAIALARIIDVAVQQGKRYAVESAASATEQLQQSNDWRVLSRLAALLLNAGRTDDAFALAERVARYDVSTTLANTLTFNTHKPGYKVEMAQPIITLTGGPKMLDDIAQKNDGWFVLGSAAVKTGRRPTQTEDRAIPDQRAAQQVEGLVAGGDWQAAEKLLATVHTPAIRARTLTNMATYTSDPVVRLVLWLQALDAARLAGWRVFETTVGSGQAVVEDPDIRVAVEAVVSEVSQW